MTATPVNLDSFTTALSTWQTWVSHQHLALQAFSGQQARLVSLFDALLTANQHTNLTRIQSVEDFINRHLWESLTPLLSSDVQTLLQSKKTTPLKLIDVGSGAGFPLLVWVAALESLDIPYEAVAVEATAKKARFIEQVGEAWQLKRGTLNVCAHRVEDLGQTAEFRDKFDVVTARAVAALPSLVEVCLPLVIPQSGLFMAWKGSSAQQELQDAKKILNILRGQVSKTFTAPSPWSTDSDKPYEGHLLDVLVFTKSAPTPSGYPRRTGLPFHKPVLA